MSEISETPPAYDDSADARLIQNIANGDRNSFRGLYERYDGLLFTTINRVLNDREDSEDVLQEVMGSLWQKAHMYHPGRGRPITWFASMARNRAIDRLRMKQRQSRIKTAFTNEIGAAPRGNSGISGLEAATRRDACHTIRSAVMELTDVQREAIEKVYFEGLTQQQIADELGEPLGTVKARVRRGLAKLRKTVKPA
tara:strand:+ start:9908 stop:10498 length:591 start_codon:yes stop_codon:yes gene_type:complete